MRSSPVFALLLAGMATAASSPAISQQVSQMAAQVLPGGVAVRSCEGRGGRPGGPWYVMAVAAQAGNGRYVVAGADGFIEVGSFAKEPEVQCLSPAEARVRNQVIAESEGVHGHLDPTGAGTVACVFIEPTVVECWQHSPRTRSLVRVGGWIT